MTYRNNPLVIGNMFICENAQKFIAGWAGIAVQELTEEIINEFGASREKLENNDQWGFNPWEVVTKPVVTLNDGDVVGSNKHGSWAKVERF